MFRRGDKVDAETLEIVVRIRQSPDLGFAAIAGAGVDLPDIQRPAKQRQNLAANTSCDRIVGEDFAMARKCPNGE